MWREDMERYREALEETGGALGGVEPISRFHEAFQGAVDAAYAAAVVGLETEILPRKGYERIRGPTERWFAGAIGRQNGQMCNGTPGHQVFKM